jgi:hypothetical protein
MKGIYKSIFKWLFRWLHPDIGVGLAQYLSVKKQTYFQVMMLLLGEEKRNG